MSFTLGPGFVVERFGGAHTVDTDLVARRPAELRSGAMLRPASPTESAP